MALFTADPIRQIDSMIDAFDRDWYFDRKKRCGGPASNLRHLTEGHLAGEKLREVLVPAISLGTRLLDAVRKYAPILSTASAILGIATNWTTVSTVSQGFKVPSKELLSSQPGV